MKNRLPVYIENLDLPDKEEEITKSRQRSYSYGYISVLNILSIFVTLVSLAVIIGLRK